MTHINNLKAFLDELFPEVERFVSDLQIDNKQTLSPSQIKRLTDCFMGSMQAAHKANLLTKPMDQDLFNKILVNAWFEAVKPVDIVTCK